jgi:flagellar assembly protein FliH
MQTDSELLRQQEVAIRQALRQEGRNQAITEARAEFETALNTARESMSVALRDFARERGKYYQRLESEVVRLALSIARHILHREAQIDEFLLAGIVRVALEKTESRTGVTLRIHPSRVAEWKAYFAQHLEPAYVPEIAGDSTLDLERCLIETELGSAEVGAELQLKEIENGFMDLLAQRPGVIA